MTASPLVLRTLPFLIAAGHVALLLGSLRQNFVAVDEVGHVPSGLYHWQTGKFNAYRVNPPLSRLTAALPMMLGRPQLDLSHLTDRPGYRPEWRMGRDFSTINGARYFDLVCLARLATVVWSLVGAWLIYRWAGELYGRPAGLLGMALWCFGPNVLAYAGLVIPDVPSAVAGLAASYVFWKYLRAPSWDTAFLAGILLGVAELTKFTLLALYGVWPLLWALHRFGDARSPLRAVRPWSQAGQGLLVVVLSLFVINWGYAFENTCWQLRDYRFVSETFAGDRASKKGQLATLSAPLATGNRFRDDLLGKLIVPVPADYVLGIDQQRRDFESGWNSYLRGRWREGGWWYYYLYALAVKVPLGTWGLVLGGLLMTVLGYRGSATRWDELCVLLPGVVILAFVSSQTGFNHHMRYVAPIFPFFAIIGSKPALFLNRRHWRMGLVVACLTAWMVVSSLRIYPHYLSYFNEAAGGPENGPAHLVDSNVDWGQDLLFLKRWYDEHPEARPLQVAYFSQIDPRVVGIDYTLPPFGPPEDFDPESPVAAERFAERGPRPGWYAISVNFVYGAPYATSNGKATKDLKDDEDGLTAVSLNDYHYFARFRPVARAGYSIYIYHITPEEANAVRGQMGLPPL